MDMNKIPDIYFTPEYGRLYEKHEGGILDSFSFQNDNGEVYFQFIKRPLTDYTGFSDYWDIITPYGYSGPIILSDDREDTERLIRGFGNAFREYCRENKIVSSFVRFHTVLNNALQFRSVFDEIQAIRKTVAIDLTKDVFFEEFGTKTRNEYRRAVKNNIVIEYDDQLEKIDDFIRLYESVMDKRNASQYYYFPKEYYNDLKKLKDSVELANAVCNGKIVASALFLKYNGFIHYHLSATTEEGNRLNAMEFILMSRAMRAKEEGFQWMHLGGGVSNAPDDSLLRFKKKFSKTEPFDFNIGKSIYDNRAYGDLCRIAESTKNQKLEEGFFPAYRSL